MPKTNCPDCLDLEEVLDHILKQIPIKLREKVMSAELKRQEDYFWVRISIPHGETSESVVREFEIIRRKRFSETEKERGYVLINARTSQEKEALLEMDGDRLGTSILRVEPVDYHFGSDDIFQFVTARIKRDEYVRSYNQLYDENSGEKLLERSKGVKAVQEESAEVDVFWNEGKGFNQKRQGHTSSEHGYGNGRGRSLPRKSSESPRPGKGKGKGESPQKPREETKKGDKAAREEQSGRYTCYYCRDQGWECKHDYRTCEKAKAKFTKNNPEEPKSPKGRARSWSRPPNPEKDKQH